ncbi:hypothetical protein [Aquimarina sp. MMG016]|uniref:hypothetical protein n=1 Tax=Aquimarina sp. MMG016 TaxID=2822690 RepID=UPI001B39F493|nr:hypothetical protein [Aquimarina sp. MMG016]MBQ4819769.1 hypothetical protein [Aquimarina sp. MMG016]
MHTKRFLFLVLSMFMILSCEDDDRADNPFLPNVSVNFEANLNLPQFSQLEFQGNTVIVETGGVGIKGLILHNSLSGGFRAFELSDPNHFPNSCSTQTFSGSVSTCNCEDENKYDLNTGVSLSGLPYGLKPYRVQLQGSSLFISN